MPKAQKGLRGPNAKVSREQTAVELPPHSPGLVDDVILNGERKVLFVAEPTKIHAYGQDKRLLWSRSEFGGYDAQLKTCANGVNCATDTISPRTSIWSSGCHCRIGRLRSQTRPVAY